MDKQPGAHRSGFRISLFMEKCRAIPAGIKKAWTGEDRRAVYVLAFALIFISGFAVYAWMLNNRMFWDDDDFILRNSYIRDWSYLPKMFSENVIAGSGLSSNYYRPVLLVAFSFFWHAWQSWPVGYHLMSVLIHCVDAGLIFALLWRLFGRRGLALCAALIFLLHPVQTESVSYANSLGDSLSVLWLMAGLIFYQSLIRHREAGWRRALIPAGFYILAILSKETAIIFPGLALLLEVFSGPPGDLRKEWRNILRRMIPLAATAAVYVVLRATVLNFGGTFNLYESHNAFTDNLGVRMLTFARSYLTYVTLIFHPAILRMERIAPFETGWSIPVLIGVGLAAATLAGIVLLFKKNREISFGLAWFLACLAPTSNILVPINGLIYEHWLYLPIAGMGLAFAAAGSISLRKIFREGMALRIGALIIGAILVYFSIRTMARNSEWRDAITFYRQTLTYAPQSYRIWNNYGMVLSDAGRLAEAEEAYGKAIKIDDSAAVAHHNLGNLYYATGRLAQAEAEYKKAVSLQPTFLFSYARLAELYRAEGREKDAEEVLTEYNSEWDVIKNRR